MIDRNNDIQQKNIDLLLEGYWYEDLPPIIDVLKITDSVKNILEEIDQDKYNDFEKTNGIITRYKNTTSPDYVYNDGIETITFFEYKKNGALREMQLPNLKYYCTFVYNTIAVYEELFKELYSNDKYEKYICNSNSYVLLNEVFLIQNPYKDITEFVEEGIFAVKNSKTTGQLVYDENNKRYLDKQGTKLYSVKVDIESFYPNVYTHFMGKIKDMEPYKDNFECKSYFDFLDYYNMKINNNQTKGIISGVFSSTVSAELLMLCVDNEINKNLEGDISYIRYVDDMTFFSDSLEKIYSILPTVQRVLNKFRLRINNNKTESQKSIYTMSYVDMYELKERFDFFKYDFEGSIEYNKDIFYNIKGYIARAYDNNQKSEIKAFLTLLKNAIESKKLIFDEEGRFDLKKNTVAYMLQLACLEPIFASRCYRVIIAILDLLNDGQEDRETYEREEILLQLKSKNKMINSTHQDSLLQIWHYYVLREYDVDLDIKEILNDFEGYDINPIILASFVKKGDDVNREVFEYIKNTYSAVGNKEGGDSWKKSIMFSKWWLPLLVIYQKDKKDYSGFYSSNCFHDIYKKMRTEESETDDPQDIIMDDIW